MLWCLWWWWSGLSCLHHTSQHSSVSDDTRDKQHQLCDAGTQQLIEFLNNGMNFVAKLCEKSFDSDWYLSLSVHEVLCIMKECSHYWYDIGAGLQQIYNILPLSKPSTIIWIHQSFMRASLHTKSDFSFNTSNTQPTQTFMFKINPKIFSF